MNFREHWRHFKSDPPGERFARRYARRRLGHRGLLQTLLTCAGAAIVIVAGLIMLPLPGPGSLLLLFGAALIAEESLSVARWMDHVERWARAKWSKRR